MTFLIPFIAPAMRFVEKLFSKPKSGADKMDAVLAALRAVLQVAAEKGQVSLPDGKQPTDDYLRGQIEAEFQRIASAGTLGADPPEMPRTPSMSGTLHKVRGYLEIE
jgi:hypothetical protein